MTTQLATAWTAIETAVEALDPETVVNDGSGLAYRFIDSADEEYGGGGHRTLIWDERLVTDGYRDVGSGQTRWLHGLRAFWHRDKGVGLVKEASAPWLKRCADELEYLRRTVSGTQPGGTVNAIMVIGSDLSHPTETTQLATSGTGRIPSADVYEGRIALAIEVIEAT